MTDRLSRSVIEPVNPKLNVSRNANLPHSPGIRVGDYIFLSGMGPVDPVTGGRNLGPIAEQIRQTLRNMAHMLESAGLGLFLAFGAIPRMILGPVLVVIEGVTLLLFRGGVARALLAGAMLMDVVPIGLYALHFARTVHYQSAFQHRGGTLPTSYLSLGGDRPACVRMQRADRRPDLDSSHQTQRWSKPDSNSRSHPLTHRS